ncbi:hypothetical protein C8R43DRAFT_1205776 [Mycena crocata]|nr:hypothetical protein C8R43DRAFT_1205776 [Mycena crocata]
MPKPSDADRKRRIAGVSSSRQKFYALRQEYRERTAILGVLKASHRPASVHAAITGNERDIPSSKHSGRPSSSSQSLSTSSSSTPAIPTPPTPAPTSTVPTPPQSSRIPPTETPTYPTFASPPSSPNVSSKLPRFLQSPAQRDCSKSLNLGLDRPPSSASSHSTSNSHTSHTTSNSNSTSPSGGNRRRFLGLGKGEKEKDSAAALRERERERQRLRDVERGAPSAAELLTPHESGLGSPTEYDFAEEPGSPPSAYSGGTARAWPRTRSERHFSASTPPSLSSSNSHSHSGHRHADTLQLQRTPSRLGADGPLATRLSGWFAHLVGSTNDLSLTLMISGSLSHGVSTAAALAGGMRRRASVSAADKSSHSNKSNSSSGSADKEKGGGSGSSGAKTSLLDRAVCYMLDGDAAPDWIAGVGAGGRGADGCGAATVVEFARAWALHFTPFYARTSNARAQTIAVRIHVRLHERYGYAQGQYHPRAESPSYTSPPDPRTWAAAFHGAFYAQVWCTYPAGFEPIWDLPGLASLPPPLVFPGMGAVGTPVSSANLGSSSALTSSSHAAVPHGHGHGHGAHQRRVGGLGG